nr:septal ring lytic transglycosylase RlpA family protein [Kingella kingae]
MQAEFNRPAPNFIFNSRLDFILTKIQPTFLATLATALALNQAAYADNSDRVVRAEKLHPTANLSYKVAGKRYYPQKNVQDFSQTGRASWYGPGFQGKRTSSGERFDMHKLTAAHPTLPIPSYARVTNLSNGRSVVVRINDRGPFHSSRVLDVSREAANKLGFLSAGTANVRVEALKAGDSLDKPKTQVAQKPATDNIYVSVKTFEREADAQAFVRVATQRLNDAKATQRAIMLKRGDSYVVQVGPFNEQKHADETHSRLNQVAI